MKKFISILLAFFLLGGAAMAEGIDYASMTDVELRAILDGVRNELVKRELKAGDKILLFEQNGVSVYLTGKYQINSWGEGNHTLELEATIVNESDAKISVFFDTVSVNGWEVSGIGIVDINPGKKKKDDFKIHLNDADVTAYEEIEDIEFEFYVYDADANKTIFRLEDPVKVLFNQQ